MTVVELLLERIMKHIILKHGQVLNLNHMWGSIQNSIIQKLKCVRDLKEGKRGTREIKKEEGSVEMYLHFPIYRESQKWEDNKWEIVAFQMWYL